MASASRPSSVLVVGALLASCVLSVCADQAHATGCTADWGTCKASGCCISPLFRCYEKDAAYAQCRPSGSCTKGVHGDDPVKTPWTCKDLSPPVAPACAADWGNCRSNRCCASPAQICYEKDAAYAQCRPAGQCNQGVHGDDPVKTPWSCRALSGPPATEPTPSPAPPATTPAPPAPAPAPPAPAPAPPAPTTTAARTNPTTAPATTTATTATTSTAACEDLGPYCQDWAQGGECQTNPGYMNFMCRRSCRLCGASLLTAAGHQRMGLRGSSSTAASPDTSPAGTVSSVTPAGCAGDWGGCRRNRCCTSLDHVCYEKDATFAQCRPSGKCEKGVHGDDPIKTPWSCKVLSAPPTPAPPACAADWGACGANHCCASPGHLCYEKDARYAQCRPAGRCSAGVHDDDPVKTPWTCRLLSEQKPPSVETTAFTTPLTTTTAVTTTTMAATSTEACHDLGPYCQQWAQSGECGVNPAYMIVQCRKACGLCRRLSSPLAGESSTADLGQEEVLLP